jgi:hypothetical protein
MKPITLALALGVTLILSSCQQPLQPNRNVEAAEQSERQLPRAPGSDIRGQSQAINALSGNFGFFGWN